MTAVKEVSPVVPVTSNNVSDLTIFVSNVNYYENALVIFTVAHDLEEAQRFIAEMLDKAYEIDPDNSVAYAQPGRFDSWWKREYSHEFNPLYSINTTKPGVYIFRGPDVNSNFR